MAFTATLNMSSDTQGIYCGIVVVSKNVAILTESIIKNINSLNTKL